MQKPMLEEFFIAIDHKWKPLGSEPITLNLIGSTALFLQCNYQRGTKDSDILEVYGIPKKVYAELTKLAGIDSRIAI